MTGMTGVEVSNTNIAGVDFVEQAGLLTAVLEPQSQGLTACSNSVAWFDNKLKFEVLEPLRAYARNHNNSPVRISVVTSSVDASLGLASGVGTGPIHKHTAAGSFLVNADAFVAASSSCSVKIDTHLLSVWNRISLATSLMPVCDYFDVTVPPASAVFLQAGGPIYKKQLGVGETFQVRMEYLVCWQSDAGGSIHHAPAGFAALTDFLSLPWGATYLLQGPGLVLFSSGGGTTERDLARVSTNQAKRAACVSFQFTRHRVRLRRLGHAPVTHVAPRV